MERKAKRVMGIMAGREEVLFLSWVEVSRGVGVGAAGSEDLGERFQSTSTIGI
jgi:hypothetical protein